MEVGNKIEHILNGEWMIILDIKEEANGKKYLCRTKDLREIWFHEKELRIPK